MTRLKKINYLRRLPWIWLEHLSSPAAAEGSLEAASTFSSAAAEAEARWTWSAFFFLSFGWEMQHIHGGRAVILLQGAGNYVAFTKGGHDLGVFTALHQCHLALVLLVWEGQIFWEIPAGRAVLDWHVKVQRGLCGRYRCLYLLSVCSYFKPQLHQEPLSAGHRWASLCWVRKHRMVFMAACLPRVGLLSPSPWPAHLLTSANVKMPWCKLVLVFQWILKAIPVYLCEE